METGRGLELVEGKRRLGSSELARELRETAKGIPHGEAGPVFVPLSNEIDRLLPFLALLARGFRPVVLPVSMPVRQRESLARAYPVIPFWDDESRSFLDESGHAKMPVEVSDDYDLVLPTSGSTGAPRLIVGHGDRIARAVTAIEASQGIEGCRCTAAFLPAHFSYCLVNQVLWSLFRGARLVLTPGLSMPAESFALIQGERPDFLCMVAQQVRLLLAYGFDDEDLQLPELKVLNFAGGPFPFDCWKALERFFPNARFNNNYGCTEAFPRVSARAVEGGDDDIARVGRPIGDLRLEIVDETGSSLGAGQVGRIHCSGSTTGLGVLDAEGRILPFSSTGSFPTGDWGHLDDGGELHVHGRADQIINVGGERISLIRIEHVTREGEGVGDAVATARKEENGEQWPLVIVTGPVPPEAERLRKHFALHLPRAAWPRLLLFAENWPLLPSNKPDRKGIIRAAETGRYPSIWDERDEF